MINFTLFYSEEDYRILNLHTLINYNHVLDYNIIKTKLTKVDYLKKTPSDSVVSYYMFKKLSTIIKDSDNTNILYILKTINSELIENISEVLNNLSQFYNKEINISILAKSKNIDSNIINNFNIKVIV